MVSSLDDWLVHLEGLHPRGEAGIELGLERVRKVKLALGLVQRCPVITVAGTNGKGSVCAMLERILLAAGYRVGLYTSPHLLRYNERVRINGVDAADETLCRAFAQVEAARGAEALTYFEFGTLAAWQVFQESGLDVVLLEVGLGGRLDAVNVFDPDCAIVTSVALDHMAYLGDTRDAIGTEKAGIFRAGKPAIVGDPLPPQSVLDVAATSGAELRLHGRDFGLGAGSDRSQWQYWSWRGKKGGLAYPALRGANQLLNASAVIAALESLHAVLPVSMGAIRQGLMTVELPGRFQVLPGRPAVVLDVAHNPQAAAVLADNLGNMGYFPETWAVVGMLGDKDIPGTLQPLIGKVDHWLVCSLDGLRAVRSDAIAGVLVAAGVTGEVLQFDTPRHAFVHAREHAGENDRIAAFGSFLTVAGVMQALRQGS